MPLGLQNPDPVDRLDRGAEGRGEFGDARHDLLGQGRVGGPGHAA